MTESLQEVLLAGVAAVVLLAAILLTSRRRRSPRDRERRRRLAVNFRGRLADATITDVSGDSIYYEYTVRGVGYTASQDVSDIRDSLPDQIEQLIGAPASLKYSPANPANSILVCEKWSGLRRRQRAQG